jgi:methylthioribose-1-phosphate isomerase
MYDAAEKLKKFCLQLEEETDDLENYKEALIKKMESLFYEDIATNKSIGDHGAIDMIKNAKIENGDKLNILTHCNTGSLATAGYGTALGM